MGERYLVKETNEQLSIGLLQGMLVGAKLRSSAHVDQNSTGYVHWWRSAVVGHTRRLVEVEEVIDTAFEEGREIDSKSSLIVNILSAEHGTGDEYDLCTTFGLSLTTGRMIVTQARNMHLDPTVPADWERLQRYPLLGVPGRDRSSQLHDLVMALQETPSPHLN